MSKLIVSGQRNITVGTGVVVVSGMLGLVVGVV